MPDFTVTWLNEQISAAMLQNLVELYLEHDVQKAHMGVVCPFWYIFHVYYSHKVLVLTAFIIGFGDLSVCFVLFCFF